MYQRDILVEGKDYKRVEHPIYKYALLRDVKCLTDILGYYVNTEWYRLTPGGMLIMRKGYHWDGASGGAIDTPSFMRASCCHDGGYQMLRNGDLLDFVYERKEHDELRKKWDRVMSVINRSDGMTCLRRLYTHWLVRRCGSSAAAPRYYDRG